MTSTTSGDAESPPTPHRNGIDAFLFSTYMDNNTDDQNQIKNIKENISAKKYPEFFKSMIDFNEYLKGVPDEDYSTYYEGFKEIRRLDKILFEKIEKEKEIKMQSGLLKKQLFEELQKIKKTGRIEMRDEKINTEKFFSLSWSPRHHSNKKDDTTDSIFAYSPFFKTELLKPDDSVQCDSVQSISTTENEYTGKNTPDQVFSNEDLLIEDFRGSSESIRDKFLQSETSSPDIVKDTDLVKAITNEVSNEGLKDVTTEQLLLKDANLVQIPTDKSLNQEVKDTMSDQGLSCVSKLTQVSSNNLLNSTLVNVNLDQMGVSDAGSSQNINSESPNHAVKDIVSNQGVLSGDGSSQNINIESPHEGHSDVVLDHVGLSGTGGSSQNIKGEFPNQVPSNVVSDKVGLISEGSSQYINNKSRNESPNEIVSSEVRLSLSHESLHQRELSETPSGQVLTKEMTSSQNEEHTQSKKKGKKNFIKRNIQLAKDADSIVSMTPEEKNRIDNLLQDLDMLVEAPKELQISDLATGNALLSSREDGFLSSREDKASLAEIDYKLRYLMTPSEFEMVALKHRSPTPTSTQRIFSNVPLSDTLGVKQFGEKILLDAIEERNIKERLRKIDEQLCDINTRDADNLEAIPALEPDVLQDLLESCAVSLTESAANSLCTTARSTNSSLDEDFISLSRQSPSDALSSVMKSPPCLADDVLQKLLAEAAPMQYNSLSPVSDISNTSDSSILKRSGSNLSTCTMSSFNSPIKELFNTSRSASASPSKVQDYSLPELFCRTSLVGQDVSSPESTPRQ